MEIAYTAHTETCTLLLDAEGVCRSVLAASSHATQPGGRGSRPTRIPSSAERCVGAQYVATLDLREPGGMTSLPVPGAQLLFARTEPNGRITLIRSAPVVRFDATPTRVESGVHARPPSQADTGRRDPLSVTQADTDDEDLTIPCDAPTIPRGRRSSLPPEIRESGVVPAAPASSRRTTIPPAPRAPRVQQPSFGAMMRPSFNTVPAAPVPPVVPRPAMPMQLRPHAAYAPPPADPTPVHVTRLPVRDHSAGMRVMAPPTRDSLPTRPSLVRISTTDASDWDIATRPYTRAAR